MIVASGNLLMAVVNDVLDYSKLESGNVDIVLKRSNLQETLNAVVHAIESEGESRRIKIRTYYDPSICEHINTDCRRLRQILYNLLGNASKFSKDGGVVELHLEICSSAAYREAKMVGPMSYSPQPVRRLDAAVIADDADSIKVLKISVKDYGDGIRESEYEEIFNPFRQASNAEKADVMYGGTGLGLSITSKLVHALGGEISVVSERGKFSEFRVAFPFEDKLVNVDQIGNQLSRTTVVLVGDDEAETEDSVLQQVEKNFRFYGVDCITVRSLKDVLANLLLPETGPLKPSQDRSYICVVHEDLYIEDLYRHLSASTSVRSVHLMTFGRKHKVMKRQWHFRSLDQIIPSVMIQRMAECLEHVELGESQPLNGCAGVVEVANQYEKLRILIAEDNVINQKVLSRILQRLGAENFVIVDNGKKAVDREAVEAFDLCFMDMQMPVMDGITACREIITRSGEVGGNHAKPLIIMCTAHVSDAFRTECMENGAFGYLPKPVTKDNVREVLDNVIFAARSNG